MAAVPYPTFQYNAPVSEECKALTAIGQCRIDLLPLCCQQQQQQQHNSNNNPITNTNTINNQNERAYSLYQTLVQKNMEVATLQNQSDTKEQQQQDKQIQQQQKEIKRLMKECTKVAYELLSNTLEVDVSIVDIEFVVSLNDIISTKGMIVQSLLDAGCQTIVIRTQTNLLLLQQQQQQQQQPIQNNIDNTNSNITLEWNQLMHVMEHVVRMPKERMMIEFGSYDVAAAAATTRTPNECVEYIQSIFIPQCKSYFCGASIVLLSFLPNNNKNNNNVCLLEETMKTLLSCGTNEFKMILQLSTKIEMDSKEHENKEEEQQQQQHSLIATLPDMVRNCLQYFKEGKNRIGLSIIDASVELLGLCYCACIRTDRIDSLYTTVVCTRSGIALGLVYSSIESIIHAFRTGYGVYYSRSRNELWVKGLTSGHTQSLHRIDLDCDGDALRFTVTQKSQDGCTGGGGCFCHLNTLTCWGPARGMELLQSTLQSRYQSAPVGSYTKRLFDDPLLLRNKLVEEAQELSETLTKQHTAEEFADVLYFACTKCVTTNTTIDDAIIELDKRTKKVTRRPGNSKLYRIEAGDAILSSSNASSSVPTTTTTEIIAADVAGAEKNK